MRKTREQKEKEIKMRGRKLAAAQTAAFFALISRNSTAGKAMFASTSVFCSLLCGTILLPILIAIKPAIQLFKQMARELRPAISMLKDIIRIAAEPGKIMTKLVVDLMQVIVHMVNFNIAWVRMEAARFVLPRRTWRRGALRRSLWPVALQLKPCFGLPHSRSRTCSTRSSTRWLS